MTRETPKPARTPCLCNALRQASRAVSRFYDDELRGYGLRTTQFSLLVYLSRLGPVRQGELGDLMLIEETTITRNIRPLINHGWVVIQAGKDRREKLVSITDDGLAKLQEARPAWMKAQERMKTSLPAGLWQNLLIVLPEVAAAAVNA